MSTTINHHMMATTRTDGSDPLERITVKDLGGFISIGLGNGTHIFVDSFVEVARFADKLLEGITDV
jgi:hypothetical protein